MNYKSQIIRGTEYVYEDIPYWDSHKKRGGHKRKYIGKKVDGKFIPNKNYLLQQELSDLNDTTSRRFFSCGAIVYLQELSEKLTLLSSLKHIFPEYESQIESILYFLLSECRPLSRFEQWEATHLHPFKKNTCQSDLAEIFNQFTDKNQERFLNDWASKPHSQNLIVTTIALEYTGPEYSYGMQQDLFIQWEKTHRPAQTILLVFEQETFKPIRFLPLESTPSSIKDYIYILNKMGIQNLEKITLLLPASLWSAQEMNDLYQYPCSFIFETDHSIHLIQEKLPLVKDHFHNQDEYSIKKGIYAQCHLLEWDYTKHSSLNGEYHDRFPVYAYYYYIPTLADIQKKRFNDFLLLLEDEISSKKLLPWHANYYRDFFKIENSDHSVTYVRRKDAIASMLDNFGYRFFLSPSKLDAETVWNLISFRHLLMSFWKNAIDRMDILSEHWHEKTFLFFLCLIPFGQIWKTVDKQEYYQENPFLLLDKLDSIQGCILDNGSIYMRPSEQEQKDLLIRLGMKHFSL